MNIEEYGKYLNKQTKDTLKEIGNTINSEQHPDKYELILSELKKRDSGIADTSSALRNDTNPDSIVEYTNLDENPYAGFWKRLGAHFLDIIILLPIIYINYWGSEQFRLFSIYYFIPGLVFGLWFNVYLVKRFGGTPGKLLLKITITKVNGDEVGYKDAFLRYSVTFILSLFMSIAIIMAILNMTNELYFSMEYLERTKYIQANMPNWHNTIYIIFNIWIWGEFIVMLTNKRRRALHDYMAGTVVILSGTEKLLSNQ